VVPDHRLDVSHSGWLVGGPVLLGLPGHCDQLPQVRDGHRLPGRAARVKAPELTLQVGQRDPPLIAAATLSPDRVSQPPQVNQAR
jgi:hypothetical protein